MPSKRPTPLENPPSASSSSESNSDDDEMQSAGEEESEEENQPTPDLKLPSKKSQSKPPSDDEDDLDEDDSDSDEADTEPEPSPEKPKPSRAAVDIKPISSKPMDEPVKPKKAVAVSSTSTPSKTQTKRSLDDVEKSEKEGKRKKKKVEEGKEDGVVEEDGGAEDSEKKKNLFARIWSDEDEILVLKELQSLAKKGMNPMKLNIEQLYEAIKGSLSIEVTKAQLLSKVQRLRQKYQSISNSKKPEPPLSKPHDAKRFNLSKKLWGPKDSNGDEVTENAKGDDSGDIGKTEMKKRSRKPSNGVASPSPKLKPLALLEAAPVESASPNAGGIWSRYPSLVEVMASKPELGKAPTSFELDLKSKVLSSTERSKAEELERQWKDLRKSELKNYSTRLQLIQDTLKLMSEAKDA
ncbi:hypothetical protein GIB67_007825 [Kingdonia uniflora]|uniref:Glabrous enhancer-binding protein-like DBD domain-containing protein n=1 Tax=Kingdonia uniflora TaxID=39325 RepID=A0A7J7N2A2_9MAGN|nr:hypothetical protein GIB67_007825 [Kingdonia uniflora]